jgi:outer membrane protein assembly factor BamD
MEDYLASRVAFRNVLKDDSENIFREDILYYIAMSSYKYALLSIPSKQKERYLTFVDDYLNFVGEIPQSPYRKELDLVYRKAQKALGRYSVEVDDIDMTERQFARERKKLDRASDRAGK